MLFLTQSSNLFFQSDKHLFLVHEGNLDYLQNSNELRNRIYESMEASNFVKLSLSSNAIESSVKIMPSVETCNIGSFSDPWKTLCTTAEGIQINQDRLYYISQSNALTVNTDIHFASNVFVSGIPLIPIGTIFPYAGTTILPEDYLWCNGSTYSRTVYSKLFDVIGTTYGAGDGISTFLVPNLKLKTPMGSGTGSALTNRVLGAVAGQSTIVLGTNELPPHTHTASTTPGPTANLVLIQRSLTGNTTATTYKNSLLSDPLYGNLTGVAPDVTAVPYGFTAITDNRGGTNSISLLHPYCVVNYIIKYQ